MGSNPTPSAGGSAAAAGVTSAAAIDLAHGWRRPRSASLLRLLPDTRGAVELLQQIVGGNLHDLVAPFRRSIDARDQPAPMNSAKVTEHEGISRLRLIRSALGQTEVPRGVLVPRVPLQIGVLDVCLRLDLAPVALENVLASLDEFPGPPDRLVR